MNTAPRRLTPENNESLWCGTAKVGRQNAASYRQGLGRALGGRNSHPPRAVDVDVPNLNNMLGVDFAMLFYYLFIYVSLLTIRSSCIYALLYALYATTSQPHCHSCYVNR